MSPPHAADIAASTPEEALRRYFGLTAFRPGQREAIDAAREGQDALVVLPTGTGKSLVYQTAALLLEGTVIVVSPLIALVRDQIEDLRERGYPDAAALHSHISDAEQRQTLAALRDGRLRLLYVTPERLASPDFLSVAREARIALLAVDEAHCIAEWGHDFRPTYLLIDDAARALGRPPILALTATATPAVREELIERLGLKQPRVIVRGFDRPNLFYEVYPATSEQEKRDLLARLIARGEAEYDAEAAARLRTASEGAGLVYTALTKTARSLSQWLNRNGVHSAYYHGQLRAAARTAVHERFREGSVRAIAATNAFGMGIDRADLRFVVHFDAPPSVEAYYQESGRAGRDGGFSRCPLLFSEEDLGRAAFVGGSGGVDLATLERIALVLDAAPKAGAPLGAIAEATGIGRTLAVRALELLVAVEAVVERRGRYRPLRLGGDAIERAVEREQRRRRHDRTRVEMVRAYARHEGCRRQFLLQYFGQYDAPDACGMCDRCVPRAADAARIVVSPPAEAVVVESPFQSGDAVEHDALGAGVVQTVGDRRITVLFTESGYRTLDLGAVLDRGLLRPAS
jgi:ATP-dependent DNA helicase RecQ